MNRASSLTSAPAPPPRSSLSLLRLACAFPLLSEAEVHWMSQPLSARPPSAGKARLWVPAVRLRPHVASLSMGKEGGLSRSTIVSNLASAVSSYLSSRQFVFPFLLLQGISFRLPLEEKKGRPGALACAGYRIERKSKLGEEKRQSRRG